MTHSIPSVKFGCWRDQSIFTAFNNSYMRHIITAYLLVGFSSIASRQLMRASVTRVPSSDRLLRLYQRSISTFSRGSFVPSSMSFSLRSPSTSRSRS